MSVIKEGARPASVARKRIVTACSRNRSARRTSRAARRPTLCLLTSVILQMLAPLAAASVRNPLRRLWPAQAAGSRPTRCAYSFTTVAALNGESGASCTRPPFSTERHTGPALISAAASHAWAGSTGAAGSRAGWRSQPPALPCQSWTGGSAHAARPARLGQILDPQRHQRGAARGPGEPFCTASTGRRR